MGLVKKHLLQWYQELGVDCFLNEKPQNRSNNSNTISGNQSAKTTNFSNMNSVELARELAKKCNKIEELKEVINEFEQLDVRKGAMNTVFADGNPQSDIMLIGEAPGAREDQHGIPFCGQSGKLLDNILAAIKINRTRCYITNIMFWRPPGNRRPTRNEINTCRPFVEKHVALVNPKVIILVGSTAVESLLNLKTPMSQLRNQSFKYQNEHLLNPIDTFVIFHPSYLLRQPSQKKTMWLDIQKIYNFYKGI